MKKKELLEKLNRQLDRAKNRYDEIKLEHDKKESSLTYWAGRDRGYFEEKVYLLEDIIHMIEELD